MNVDGDSGVAEEIKTAGVVEMQVSDYDHFYIFNGVACLGDLGAEVHGWLGVSKGQKRVRLGDSTGVVVYTIKDVIHLGTDLFGVVGTSAGFV